MKVIYDPILGKLRLQLEGGGSSAVTASDVEISDAGGYYEGSDAEAALQEIGETLAGRDAVDVTTVDASNNVTFTGSAVPAGVKAPSGVYYPVEKTSVTIGSSGIVLNFDAFLAYEGVASFSGTWKVYFAGGGAHGATPVRGVDYWTAADIAAIEAYCDNAILNGEW